MSEADVLFTRDHIWLKPEGETAILGITHFAQQELGDIIFVVLPAFGTRLAKGQIFCSLESMSYFHEFCMPVSGEVIAVNENIDDSPEVINIGPLDKGWLIEVALFDTKELEKLMKEPQYKEYIRGIRI